MQLLDKVALVTGGAKRIGREIALALAREGCDVVVHHRSSHAEAEALTAEIRAMGRQAWCVEADFTQPHAPVVAMRTAWKLAGWIDILVNNASTYSRASLAETTPEKAEALLRVNALAPMFLVREMQRLATESEILPADYTGHVINVLDRSIAKPPEDGNQPYWLSKRMLADFTRSAALDAAPRFTINAVAPGPVLPPVGLAAPELAGPLPLGHRPTPADIASAVLFLSCASSVTGQILSVDAGQSLL